MRLFLSIEISSEVRQWLNGLIADLRRHKADIAWTGSSNFHLTLKFLGEINSNDVPKIIGACNAIQIPAFNLSISNAGAFPNVRNPKVLWIGLGGELATLKVLQRSIEDALEDEGFPREAKSFRPHLTLGRIRRPGNSETTVAQLLSTQLPETVFPVNRYCLMRSELLPGGAKYTELAHFELVSRVTA